MESQCMIRAVLLLMVIQLHCEILLAAKDASELDNSNQYEDPLTLNSLEHYADPSPWIIGAPPRRPRKPSKSPRRQVFSDDASDLDSWRRLADPSPHIIELPNRKPQNSRQSRRRQVLSDDATDLDIWRRSADPHIIELPNRRPQNSKQSRRRQVLSDDATDLDSYWRRSADPSPHIIELPNRRPQNSKQSRRHQVYLDDAADLDNLRQYVITTPQRKSVNLRPTQMMYSDELSGESDEYSSDVSKEYSDDVSDQYSDAVVSSVHGTSDSRPARRSNTLLKLSNVGVKALGAIPKILLGDDDDEKPRSHYKTVETIVKCPEGTELVDDHCKVISDPYDYNRGTKIKKVVVESDYMDDY